MQSGAFSGASGSPTSEPSFWIPGANHLGAHAHWPRPYLLWDTAKSEKLIRKLIEPQSKNSSSCQWRLKECCPARPSPVVRARLGRGEAHRPKSSSPSEPSLCHTGGVRTQKKGKQVRMFLWNPTFYSPGKNFCFQWGVFQDSRDWQDAAVWPFFTQICFSSRWLPALPELYRPRFCCCCCFWDRILLYSSGWPQTQAILLPQPPSC